MFRKILFLQGKHISVYYTKMYETVAKMVLNYYDNDQFDSTLFVINVLVDEYSNDIEFRNYGIKQKKYIYYQLNNAVLHPEYISLEYMQQFDEVWEVSLANIPYYGEDIKGKVVFMPLRFVDIPKIESKNEYKYDICVLNTIKENFLSRITKWWDDPYLRMKLISGYSYTDCLDELADCKYIYIVPESETNNIPIDYASLINVICSGKQAIAFNYQENILHPFCKMAVSYYDVISLSRESPVDNSNNFKLWTNNDANYEEWRHYWLGNNYKQRLNL